MRCNRCGYPLKNVGKLRRGELRFHQTSDRTMVACVWQDLADCPLTEQHLESSTDRDASSSCHWCPGCCDEAATDRRLQQVDGWSRPGRSTTPSAHHPPEAPEVVEVSVLLPAGRVDRQHVHCVQGESVRPRDTVASKRRMSKIHAHAWHVTQCAWNSHRLRSESNRSPTQIWRDGMLASQGSGHTATDPDLERRHASEPGLWTHSHRPRSGETAC